MEYDKMSPTMDKPNKSQRNVAILLHTDTKPDRDRLRGILRFARSHDEWNVLMLPGHPATASLLKSEHWQPDGIITNDYVIDHDPQLVRQWAKAPNVVLTDTNRPTPAFLTTRQACVDNDNAAIGRLAAEFFVRRNFSHLAYVQTIQPRSWSDARASAFCEAAHAHGCQSSVYETPERRFRGWGQEERRLAAWLKSLAKPCGLLAANDFRALHVLRVAALAGIDVPGQLSVLGVDNNDLFCEFSRPDLSSIEPEFEHCGFLAAETLHRMMSGMKPPHNVIRYGNPKLVERSSTFDPNGTARIVTAAKAFISANAARGISVADVAAAVGTSLRTLERRFSSIGAETISAELMNVRLKNVCKLLADTSIPIGEIAHQCGFNSDVRLKIVFRKAFGMTMSAFRAELTARGQR